MAQARYDIWYLTLGTSSWWHWPGQTKGCCQWRWCRWHHRAGRSARGPRWQSPPQRPCLEPAGQELGVCSLSQAAPRGITIKIKHINKNEKLPGQWQGPGCVATQSWPEILINMALWFMSQFKRLQHLAHKRTIQYSHSPELSSTQTLTRCSKQGETWNLNLEQKE